MDIARMHNPERWLAVLRIATGVWFIKSMWGKWLLIGGVVPVPLASQRWIDTLPQILQGYADSNPLVWAQVLLQNVLIPNAELLAHLTAVGEACVGIGLTFGLLTRTSAIGALFLLGVYELAAFGQPFPRHGLRLFMIVAAVAFFFARAGAVWGLDGWLHRRKASRSA